MLLLGLLDDELLQLLRLQWGLSVSPWLLLLLESGRVGLGLCRFLRILLLQSPLLRLGLLDLWPLNLLQPEAGLLGAVWWLLLLLLLLRGCLLRRTLLRDALHPLVWILLLHAHGDTVGESRWLDGRGLDQSLKFDLGERSALLALCKRPTSDLALLQLGPEGLHQPLLLPQHAGQLLDLLVFLLEHQVLVLGVGRGIREQAGTGRGLGEGARALVLLLDVGEWL